MCGIFCAISQNGDAACHLHGALKTLLHNRGPDASDQLLIDNVVLAGNVLWQQGAAPQKQPLTEGPLVLLFNGDLYNLAGEKPTSQSDSAWLMAQLIKCSDNDNKGGDDDSELLSLLQRLEGPYCLLIYNVRDGILYFCRDALGRNSLIIERQEQCIRLLSTSYHLEQQQQRITSLELPPLGLYKLHIDVPHKCQLYPWQPLTKAMEQQLLTLDAAMQWKTQVAPPISPDWLLSPATPPAASYDLYALAEGNDKLELLYARLLENAPVQRALSTLGVLLQRSVAARVLHTAPVCRHCVASERCTHAKTCILFSGGIDCTILALLADKLVPRTEPIELINVAFERVAAAAGDRIWDVPDRQTAQQSQAELRRLCPQRDWPLLEVNVSREELKQQLNGHIRQLIYPLETVLDECLGGAFWFAAAAPKSTARVALLGSGADELFGGYKRHRNAYKRAVGDGQARHEAVRQELELDWQRIPARNLARDDRIIADCGKTARAPFIEEHVVRFVRSLAPQQRCCYTLPEGVGDKLLLRLYGHSLGLRDATLLKKRAIQFGSRIADKRQQAKEKSEYLRFASLQLS